MRIQQDKFGSLRSRLHVTLMFMMSVFITVMFVLPTPYASATAEEFCKDKDAGVVGACKLGYENSLEGKTIEEACKNQTGAAETACELGAAAGVQGKNNGEKPASQQAATQPDCDVEFSSPLSWIICPVIDLGANLSDFVFRSIVSPLLKDIPISTDPNDPAFKAWQQFRILGNILLVGTLLAVVYAQARGPK